MKANRKMIIIGIIIVVIFLVLYFKQDFRPDCDYFSNTLEEKINEINYCNSDDDCTNIGLVLCKFGCWQLVNKNETNKIQEIIDISKTYATLCPEKTSCLFSCYNPEPVCINNTCKDIREK